jgi:hypothetical protein
MPCVEAHARPVHASAANPPGCRHSPHDLPDLHFLYYFAFLKIEDNSIISKSKRILAAREAA